MELNDQDYLRLFIKVKLDYLNEELDMKPESQRQIDYLNSQIDDDDSGANTLMNSIEIQTEKRQETNMKMSHKDLPLILNGGSHKNVTKKPTISPI